MDNSDLGRVGDAEQATQQSPSPAVSALSGEYPSRCTECNGEGYVEKSPNRDYSDGSYRPTQWKDCPACYGRGYLGW